MTGDFFLVGKESGGLRLEMGGAGWVTGDFFFWLVMNLVDSVGGLGGWMGLKGYEDKVLSKFYVQNTQKKKPTKK